MSASPLERLVDGGHVPDRLLRPAIRAVLRLRLREEREATEQQQQERLERWIDQLRQSDIAPVPELANAQHYEVPAGFYEQVLGPRLKYSSGYYPPGVETLEDAEDAMLDLVAHRAQLHPGQRVLDLGCGWGSFSLWAAARFPGSRFVALSNSHSQKAFIDARARALGLDNLEVVTADVSSLADLDLGRFDRVVSIELFEHVRNYEALLAAIADKLEADGSLFVHHFAHQRFAYPYEVKGASDWMAKHFFSGGQMPSADLLLHFQHDLVVDHRWRIDGTHYARTCEGWLARLDEHAGAAQAALAAEVGPVRARRDRARWRVFLLACAELFAFRGGREWLVMHYRFTRR
jgi:cyclopropane-fatty-acyl-phospholipid synthase